MAFVAEIARVPGNDVRVWFGVRTPAEPTNWISQTGKSGERMRFFRFVAHTSLTGTDDQGRSPRGRRRRGVQTGAWRVLDREDSTGSGAG
jgi:hypothetical protein